MPMLELKQVIHTSHATKPMSDHELKKILLSARKKNKENHITGMLIYVAQRFIQVLEGPELAIDTLLSSIFSDSRHDNRTLVLSWKIDKRSFPDWSMSFEAIELEDLKKIEGFQDIRSTENLDQALELHPSLASSMLEQLYTNTKDHS